MRPVEFEQNRGNTVWVNPMFVLHFRADDEKHLGITGVEPRGGTKIHLFGQPSYSNVWVKAEPDEVARRLSEAMG